MRLLKGQIDSKLTWLIFILLLALMPSFFLHYRINGFIVMLIIIFGFIQYIFRPVAPLKMGAIILMPLLFVTFLFGQFYTDDLKNGWTLIERSLTILLIPFATISVSRFSENRQNKLMLVFIASGLLASLYCLTIQTITALETGSIYTSEKTTHFLFNRFMHHRLSEPLGLHAVYFSSYIAVISIYLYYKIFKLREKNIHKVITISLFLFFVFMIFLLKSAIISFGFSLIVILITIFQLKKVERYSTKISLIIIVFLTICYGVFALKSKIEFINLSYNMADEHMGMLAIRLSIWENALSVIQPNWILGVGTGDADKTLLEQYHKSGFLIGAKNDYNCHNMYLQYWLGNGILGIGIFITYLILLFRKAIKHKNLVFIGFLVIFILFSFTESTLRVQKGMVFFMIFSSLFYWRPTLWSDIRL